MHITLLLFGLGVFCIFVVSSNVGQMMQKYPKFKFSISVEYYCRPRLFGDHLEFVPLNIFHNELYCSPLADITCIPSFIDEKR